MKASEPPRLGLGTMLRHLLEMLDGDLERVYAGLGLDYRPRYTPVMRVLLKQGPSSIRRIAHESCMTHSAASQTVAQMTKRGLVVAEPGHDHRERIVRLSARGRSMLPALRRQWSATEAAAASLSSELPIPLEDVLKAAIHALECEPFQKRIRRAQLSLNQKPISTLHRKEAHHGSKS